MSTLHRTPREVFTYEVRLPSGWSRTLLSIIGGLFLYVPFFLITGDLLVSGILAFILWLISILIGRFWAFLSVRLVDFLVIQPLRDYKNGGREGRRLRYFFGGDIDRVFLQYEVKDLDLEGLYSFLKYSIGILVPFTAIFAFIWNGLTIITGDFGGSLLWALILSYFGIGLYFPTSMVLEDARIMTIRANGVIDYSASNAKNVLDGLFKVTGIISGYNLLSSQPEFQSEHPFVLFLVYVVILAILIPLSYPILFNSLVTYFKRHNRIVNDFRIKALKLEIPIKKTAAVDISREELEGISVANDVEVRREQVKRWGLIPRTITRKVYTKEVLDQVRLVGAWVCRHCLEVGGRIESERCENCGRKKSELLEPNS